MILLLLICVVTLTSFCFSFLGRDHSNRKVNVGYCFLVLCETELLSFGIESVVELSKINLALPKKLLFVPDLHM